MKQWTIEQAQAWGKQQPWFFGANFVPSTAINQLEMWQAETFDPLTIERELGYAQRIGMNLMRVYLHDLLWEQDREKGEPPVYFHDVFNRDGTFLYPAEEHDIRRALGEAAVSAAGRGRPALPWRNPVGLGRNSVGLGRDSVGLGLRPGRRFTRPREALASSALPARQIRIIRINVVAVRPKTRQAIDRILHPS